MRIEEAPGFRPDPHAVVGNICQALLSLPLCDSHVSAGAPGRSPVKGHMYSTNLSARMLKPRFLS